MLISGLKLIGMPVMSLQTGARLATTKIPIIDPSNLKIIAYEVDGPLLVDDPSFLRVADVREMSEIGMIIDSSDEFISKDDVISIQKIYDLNFKLIGLTVIDELNHKLGKVANYNLDTDSFIIQQLNIKRGIIKSLADTELIIHRSQIIEINNRAIIVKTSAKKLDPITKTNKLTYMNPFRSNLPQTDNRKI